MPNPPRNFPKWLGDLFQYVAAQEGEEYEENFLPTLTLLQAYWADFVSANTKPSLPRAPVDPAKKLDTALKKYAKEVDSAKGKQSSAMLRTFQESMENLPPKLKRSLPIPISSTGAATSTSDASRKRQRLVEPETIHQAEEFYETFCREVDANEVDHQHPLVSSVDGLYGITRSLIDQVSE